MVRLYSFPLLKSHFFQFYDLRLDYFFFTRYNEIKRSDTRILVLLINESLFLSKCRSNWRIFFFPFKISPISKFCFQHETTFNRPKVKSVQHGCYILVSATFKSRIILLESSLKMKYWNFDAKCNYWKFDEWKSIHSSERNSLFKLRIWCFPVLFPFLLAL